MITNKKRIRQKKKNKYYDILILNRNNNNKNYKLIKIITKNKIIFISIFVYLLNFIYLKQTAIF